MTLVWEAVDDVMVVGYVGIGIVMGGGGGGDDGDGCGEDDFQNIGLFSEADNLFKLIICI